MGRGAQEQVNMQGYKANFLWPLPSFQSQITKKDNARTFTLTMFFIFIAPQFETL